MRGKEQGAGRSEQGARCHWLIMFKSVCMVTTQLDHKGKDIFSFVPESHGLVISKSYGRVMPAKHPADKPPPSAVPLGFARGQGVPHSVTL